MNKKKNAANIIEGIVIVILIALIGGMLFLYFSFGEKGAAPKIFGYTIYHTHATNMEPKIPAGTVIFAKESEIDSIKAGSVVLCDIDGRTVLTRVVQLVNENGVMSYVVRFDTANEDITYKIPRENVVAKAVRQDPKIGGLLDFATSTKGIMTVIIIPSFIIIVFQIIRILNVKKAEEDAYSLDDLDEIMLSRDDDISEDIFEEPAERRLEPEPPKQEAVIRIVRDDSAEPEVKFPDDAPQQVLSVDKNGKAELKFTEVDKSRLFTYDNLEITAGGNESQGEGEGEKPKETGGFMSNVLPEKIAAAAGNVGQPAAPAQPPKTVKRTAKKAGAANGANANAAANADNAAGYAPSPVISAANTPAVRVDEKTAANAAKSIPAKAVVPKEKLSPPPKKSNGKTISELMSIIDAEESKLR
ncbi:MAG: hypothetical protein NC078_07050 [Ruminococcus sp.]|nr:hypothetical protein [Ruminococcus sp.]